MSGLIQKGFQALRREGFGAFRQKAWRRIRQIIFRRDYEHWVERYDVLSVADRVAIRGKIANFKNRPLISILMPVYDVDERWLRKAIESVRDQIYENWELCIADDCSPSPHIKNILDEYSSLDPRIKLIYRSQNGHISAASNSALEMVTGHFTVLMDHDDELSLHALYFVVKEINLFPDADVIYSDEDKIDGKGRRFAPTFKPDWSQELFYAVNLTTHLVAYRTSLIRKVGGFRMGFEGSQDYDLALRVTAAIPPQNIRHIPKILYHWRAIAGSVALSGDQKPYAHELARKAITENLEAKGVAAKSVKGYADYHRITFLPAQRASLVSVIVIGKLNSDMLNLLQKPDTDHRFEFVVTDSPAKFAQLNKAAYAATGSLLLFLHGETLSVSDHWLDELIGYAVQTDIGAVGAKIISSDDTIKYAGYTLNTTGSIGQPYFGAKRGHPGYNAWLMQTRNLSAVSINCLAIRKDVFERMSGFDDPNFPDTFGDVDLCLRLLEQGYRNVWTPWAEIVQPQKNDPANPAELNRLKQRHAQIFERDPYLSPNLSLESEDLSFAFPPRVAKY